MSTTKQVRLGIAALAPVLGVAPAGILRPVNETRAFAGSSTRNPTWPRSHNLRCPIPGAISEFRYDRALSAGAVTGRAPAAAQADAVWVRADAGYFNRQPGQDRSVGWP